jgi:hypothetical protein
MHVTTGNQDNNICAIGQEQSSCSKFFACTIMPNMSV